jgi:hypothetical protein
MHLAQRRLRNLRLWGNPFDTPEEVVRWLGAVQSQDYGPAKWSVAQRTHGVTDEAMDRAFADGAILRTHVLRPTWHFVLPEDIRWMLELTAPRVHALNASFYRYHELDHVVFSSCNGLLIKALQSGQHRTRNELATVLADAGIVASGPRLAGIVMNAELNGVVCSGAPRGKQHTYALLDERAPWARRLSRDEALAELTLRYFRGHGPATVKDFRWWSSLTVVDIKRGLDMVESQLESEVVDGVPYWFSESESGRKSSSPSVHLLHTYDECIVGYSESRHVVDVSGAARSSPLAGAIYNPAVILDGQVAGRWARTLEEGGVVVEATLYTPFSDSQLRALQTAADTYGDFVGLPTTIRVS